ncbi:hypothetical protein TNCV_1481471 [Trichonephila clavipes]|nr:hypothetical protein TNCV_1481471 [Trichonephila clavipes]
MPSWHEDTLNSHSLLVRLVGADKMWQVPDHPQGFLPQNCCGTEQNSYVTCMLLNAKDNMLTKYQMIKLIDFCEVWFLPESVARVAAIVGDHRCHTPRH